MEDNYKLKFVLRFSNDLLWLL